MTRPGVVAFKSCVLPGFVALATVACSAMLPWTASGLGPAPDSIEYTVGAHRLVFEGRYDIDLGERTVPPRYPPWFSLTLAPAYVLLGREIGNVIVVMLAFSAVGMVLVWLLTQRMGSGGGGLVAVALVLLLTKWTNLVTLMMCDVPFTTVILGACLVYLQLLGRPSAALYALAGTLASYCFLLRPTGAAVLLPFAILAWKSPHEHRWWLKWIALSVPFAVAVAASLAYNAWAVGHPLRSPYQLISPLPHDYFSLMWSVDHIRGNVTALRRARWSFVPVLAAAAITAWRVKRQSLPALPAAGVHILRFTGLAAGPIAFVHMFYFFPDIRFFLPLQVLLLVVVGGLVGSLMENLPRWTTACGAAVLLAVCVTWRVARPPAPPKARLTAEQLRRHTPEDALIVTTGEIPYLERLVARGSRRELMPLGRDGYGSFVMSRRRIANPQPPPGSVKGPIEGLLAGGAEFLIPNVASEHPELLEAHLRRGRAVFLDVAFRWPRHEPWIDALRNRFDVTDLGGGLYRLSLPAR